MFPINPKRFCLAAPCWPWRQSAPCSGEFIDPFFSRQSLAISGSPLHWINTALIMATLVGILGQARSQVTPVSKKVFIIGASGLVIFSVIAFFFPTQPSQLILRALGGLFSMLMIPLGITAVALAFDIKLRPQAFFLVFTASGLGILPLEPISEEFWVDFARFSGCGDGSPLIIFSVWGLKLISRFTAIKQSPNRSPTASGMLQIVLWSLAILSLIYSFITFLGGERKILPRGLLDWPGKDRRCNWVVERQGSKSGGKKWRFWKITRYA